MRRECGSKQVEVPEDSQASQHFWMDGEIDSKYKEAYRILLVIREQLETLETSASEVLEGQISTNINDLSRMTDKLEGLVTAQSSTKRDLWKMYSFRVFNLVVEWDN